MGWATTFNLVATIQHTALQTKNSLLGVFCLVVLCDLISRQSSLKANGVVSSVIKLVSRSLLRCRAQMCAVSLGHANSGARAIVGSIDIAIAADRKVANIEVVLLVVAVGY